MQNVNAPPSECNVSLDSKGFQRCVNCNKIDGCCRRRRRRRRLAIHVMKEKECSSDPSCGNIGLRHSGQQQDNIDLLHRRSFSLPEESRTGVGLRSFLMYAEDLYAAALGIEILCIAAAEIGENTGLYLFGFNPGGGIAIAYVGYSLAGFTTFVAILGRLGNHRYYKTGTNTTEIDSCCSVLELDSTQGFGSNIKTTFKNFALGFKRPIKNPKSKEIEIYSEKYPIHFDNCRKRVYLNCRNSRFDFLPTLYTPLCPSCTIGGCVYGSGPSSIQKDQTIEY